MEPLIIDTLVTDSIVLSHPTGMFPIWDKLPPGFICLYCIKIQIMVLDIFKVFFISCIVQVFKNS